MLREPTLKDAPAIWEPNAVELAGGLSEDRYLSDREFNCTPDEFEKQIDVAMDLFFKGGRLADFSLKVKEGVDSDNFHKCLSCMLRSWEPSHESKMLTAGLFIAANTEGM